MNLKPNAPLAKILATGCMVIAQLAAPFAATAAAQAESASRRAASPAPQASAMQQAAPAISPAEMASTFKMLIDRMLVGDEMRGQYRRAYQLAVDDYAALSGLADIWLARPIIASKSLADIPFPIVSIAEINAAFSTLILSYLNMPPDLSEAESLQVQRAFEKAVIAFSLHFQVAASRPDLHATAPAATDAPAPARSGYRRAILRGRARLQAWRNAGAPDDGAQVQSESATAARWPHANAGVNQPFPQAPARTSHVFGSIKVTADSIEFNADYQLYRATGNVVIGIQSADYFSYTGVLYCDAHSNQPYGTGTIISIGSGADLFYGHFTADGNNPNPVIVPDSGVTYQLNRIGDFSIANRTIVISEARLYNGEAYGTALLNAATSGVTQTMRALFKLQNNGSVGGTVNNVTMTVAGSAVTVTNGVLSSARITSTASTIALPAQFGGGASTIGNFQLTPTDLVLNDGGAATTLTLPEAKFGSDGWLKITDIRASLGITAQGWKFDASAKLVVALPPNRTEAGIGIHFDSAGHISGSLDSLTITLAGCILTFGGVTLVDTGLTFGASSIRLPDVLGGLMVAIQGAVTFGKDGLRIDGKAELDLPEIRIGDGNTVKIINAHAEIAYAGGVFVFNVRGTLAINLPPNSQHITLSFTIDSRGNISTTIDRLSLTLAGCTLAIVQIALVFDSTRAGLFVDSATLTFPEWMRVNAIRLGKIAITKDGISINEGAQIDFPDLRFGDTLTITGIKARLITSNGVLVFTLRGTLRISLPKNEIDPIALTFTLDSTGYISGKVDHLRVTVSGCTLEMTEIALDYLGLSIDTAQITLPQAWGGLSLGVQDVTITRDGLSIGCGVFELPEIRFGSGDQVRIINIRATLTMVSGLYIIEARATVVFNLPQNPDLRIAFDFTIDGDGKLSGAISDIELNVMSFKLALRGMKVNNQGFYLAQAEMRTVAPWPESTIRVNGVKINSSGLSFDEGVIRLPDLVITDWLKVTNIRGRIVTVGDHYETTASANLYLKLPAMDPVTPSITFKIDASGKVSLTVTNFKLALGGCLLDIPSATFDDQGLTIPDATLRLPDWLGKASGTVKNLNIGSGGIKLEGIEIVFPDFDFGSNGMVTLTRNKATLAIRDGVYIYTLTSELNVNVSGNHLGPLNIALYIDPRGEIHAEVKLKELKFAIAGCELIVQDLALGTRGLTLGHGSLTLPKWLGSIRGEVDHIGVTKDGLIIEGSVKFKFPDIAFGKWLSMTGVSITLTQKPGRIYALTVSGALSITLPGFAVVLDAQVTVDENGHVTGQLNRPLVIGVAGGALTLVDAQFNDDGLWVRNAKLKLPSAWGGNELTLPYVTITWNNGLAFGVGFDLPDIRFGAVNFVHLVGVLKIVVAPAGFAIGISGTLELRIPDNNQNIGFYAEVSTSGTLTGKVDQLRLYVGIGWIEIVNLDVGLDHFSVDRAVLRYKGGGQAGVRNVRIQWNRLPYIDWEWALAAVNGRMSISPIDLGNGFWLTDGSAEYIVRPDGGYRTVLRGNLVFSIGNQAITATAVITGDLTGGLAGDVGPFTVTVAGLSLVVTGAKFQVDRIIVDEASLQAPAAWGGGEAEVYNLDIASGALGIGAGAFAVPDIQAGGFTLAGLRGRLLKPGADYIIDAVGQFRVPDLRSGDSCGPMVGTYLHSTPGGAAVNIGAAASGLALPDSAVTFNGCAVPIGHTGLSLTGARGRLALEQGATQAHITVSIASEAAGALAGGIAGQNLEGVLQAAPFKLDLAGAVDVYALFTAAQLRGTIADGHFAGRLAIDMDGREGELVMTHWRQAQGVDQVGSGSLAIDLARGSMFHDCLGAMCVDLPPGDTRHALDGEVGLWPDGAWGWQALVPLAPGSQASVGATIDQGGAFDASGLDHLLRLSSGGVAHIGQGDITTSNVTVPITTDVIFAMARTAGAPGLALIAPDGTQVDPEHLGSRFVYTSTMMTGTLPRADGALGAGEVLTYNQVMYIGAQVEAGVWQVKLTDNPIPGPAYLLDVLANDPVPILSQVNAFNTGPAGARVQWALTSNNTDTMLNLYATTGPITQTLALAGGPAGMTMTKPAYTGFTVARGIPTPIDGSPASLDVDLGALPSGQYFLWLEADDNRNPPARAYAPAALPIQASWADAWDAQLAAAPDYRKVALSWLPSPNPDTDSYRLIVEEAGEDAWSRDLGNVVSTTLNNLAPNQTYTITLQARRHSTGQAASGGSAVAVVPGAPFTAQAGQPALFAVSGESARAAVTLTTPMAAYPENVVLAAGDVPSGLGVAPAAQSAVPTQEGVSVGLDITTSESLPAGVYTATLIASGAGESHRVAFAVTVAEPSFRIEPRQPDISLTDGVSRAVTVDVVTVTGAPHPIELSLSDAPGGLAYAFDPPVVWPGQPATLTVTDTEPLHTGAYALQLKGHLGARTYTATLALEVTKHPYQVTPLGGWQIGRPGMTLAYTLNITGEQASQPVRLAVDPSVKELSGITAGLAALPGDPPQEVITITTPATVYLVAAVAAGAPPGGYALDVLADSFTVHRAARAMLLVPPPSLIYYMPVLFRDAS